MPTKETLQFRELLSQHQKRPEWVVPICLRGDLDAQIIDLDSQLVAIKQNMMDARLNGNPQAVEIAAKHAALREEAAKYTAHVYMRGLPKKQWADLVAKYPSDKTGEDFDEALFNEAVPACIYAIKVGDETFEPDEASLNQFLEGVTDGQWDLLAGGAARVNISGDGTPFSVLASKARPNSDEQ